MSRFATTAPASSSARPGGEPEVLRPGAPSGILVTCEHASARLPRSLSGSTEVLRRLAVHRIYDPVASEVTRRLSDLLDVPAVLARYTRLFCDVNRPPEHPEAIPRRVDGIPLRFNTLLSTEDRHRRLRIHHDGYHRTVRRTIEGSTQSSTAGGGPALLVAIHSFDPRLPGPARGYDAGILFDIWALPAESVRVHLTARGWKVAINRPYSGRRGVLYSLSRHGLAHGIPHLELELNQERLGPAPVWRRFSRHLAGAIRSAAARSYSPE